MTNTYPPYLLAFGHYPCFYPDGDVRDSMESHLVFMKHTEGENSGEVLWSLPLKCYVDPDSDLAIQILQKFREIPEDLQKRFEGDEKGLELHLEENEIEYEDVVGMQICFKKNRNTYENTPGWYLPLTKEIEKPTVEKVIRGVSEIHFVPY